MRNRKKQPYSCGLGPAFDVIGGKWKAQILWEVLLAPRRFGELKRLIPGISEKMLIQQLRDMEFDELIEREAFAEIPPRVEYRITPLGKELGDALIPIGLWGERHVAQIVERFDSRSNKIKAKAA